jgi:hypothetical protein
VAACPPAAGAQQPEPLGQAVRELADRHGSGSGRGQLDRQRQAVEPAAQFGHRVAVDRLATDAAERAALFVQPCCEQMSRIGSAEGRHRDQPLTGHTERLPRRGQQTHPATTGHNIVCQGRHRVEKVLAVVQHQQALLLGEHPEQHLTLTDPGLGAHAHHLDEGLRDLAAVEDAGQLTEPDTVDKPVGRGAGGGQ